MIELSSGIIIYRDFKGKRFYLILHYRFKGDYWDFPRGNVLEGESLKKAALRETYEETGILETDLSFVDGFEEQVEWEYLNGQARRGKVYKTVVYFLASTSKEEVKISHEHVGFKWLDFSNALKELTYENSKNLLYKARDYIKIKK